MTLIATVIVVFILLACSEIWWRKRRPHDEFSRKFIHISVGCFVAIWPFFLKWEYIELLSVAFLIGVIASRYLGIFTAIHAVERPTWSEAFFAVAVGGAAFLTHSPAIYCVALMHMGLADGLAAIVGTAYGVKNSYEVFGHKKSITGSLTFLVCSLAILLVYASFQPHTIAPVFIVGLAVSATVVENMGVYGLDNLLVPLLVVFVLERLV